ncbi:DUF1510 family protein [Bacillus salipaludis]|uniref:YrrS family protein n=1 Tax=Bacillus salipaludis TaxID=2547811 RepID=UPI003D1B091A
MNNDFDSRSGYRAKRKKTNLILNSLIVVVIVLIVFVAYRIFASGDSSASPKNDVQHTTEKQTTQNKNQTDPAEETSTSVADENASSDTVTDDSSVEDQEGSTNDSQEESTDDESTANDEKTTENKDWKPVGTTQTGEHTPVYDTSSADWQEMLNAISYATGLDQNNMIVWHLGRDRSKQNASIGTVSSKDKKQNYTVYIEWVDGQGWKPTKVEKN